MMKALLKSVQAKAVRHSKMVKVSVVVFYLVGFGGMMIPAAFPFFTRLIPFALLLSFLTFCLFTRVESPVKSLVLFLIIVLAGYFVEVAGVRTGVIFGSYQYGNNLGPKVMDTPLIIGLNWYLLASLAMSVSGRLMLKPALEVAAASFLMVGYDLVMEQVAPKTGMWTWSGDAVPFRNFAAWFLISVLFTVLIRIFRTDTRNRMAPLLFFSQLLFFCGLALFLS